MPVMIIKVPEDRLPERKALDLVLIIEDAITAGWDVELQVIGEN